MITRCIEGFQALGLHVDTGARGIAVYGEHADVNRHLYRYALIRARVTPLLFQPGKTFVGIGVNPSTATADADDPTIRRLLGFAAREQCEHFIMLNLFAVRSSDVRDVGLVPDPMGRFNKRVLELVLSLAKPPHHVVVACYGARQKLPERLHGDMNLPSKLYAEAHGQPLSCFGTTASGDPKHPLYLRRDAPIVPFGG